MVKSSGIRPLLHTFAVDVIMEEGKIRLSFDITIIMTIYIIIITTTTTTIMMPT